MKLPIDSGDYDNALACPKCGGQNLHHGCVMVFDRDEDDDTELVTTVDHGYTVVKNYNAATSYNPSARRHGLRIAMECESCGPLEDYALTVYQHKGCTFIEWKE